MKNHSKIPRRFLSLGTGLCMLLILSGCGTFYGYHEPKPRRLFYIDACEVQREKEAQQTAKETTGEKTTETTEEISPYRYNETSDADDAETYESVEESNEYEPADIIFYTQTPPEEEESYTTYEVESYTPEPYNPEAEMK